jgi:hypothetical protein
MAFKVVLDGADKGVKFATKEEAIDFLWEELKDKMSRPDFDKIAESKIFPA